VLQRIFRALVPLFPHDFQEDFGWEMEQVFRLQKSDGPRAWMTAFAAMIASFRFTSFVLTNIGALALVIATVGVYGVMAFFVSRRRHEFGGRMALGAGRSQILREIIRQGFMMSLAGITIGIPGAFWATHFSSGKSIRCHGRGSARGCGCRIHSFAACLPGLPDTGAAGNPCGSGPDLKIRLISLCTDQGRLTRQA
jgi:hypothetical protein